MRRDGLVRGARVVACVLVLLGHAGAVAHAQGAGGSTMIDASIRSAGMGGANAGVAWGDPNVWGNVATLGRVDGVWGEHGETQFLQGLAPGIWFRTNHVMFGHAGVGVCFMGEPSGIGGTRLDYGVTSQVYSDGNGSGAFDSYERTGGIALGVSVQRVLDAWSSCRGNATHFADGFDLSLGIAHKYTDLDYAPAYLGGISSATTYDVGVQARVSPLKLLASRTARGAAGVDPMDLLLLDVGAGYSELNANNTMFVFQSEDAMAYATRIKRLGFAVRTGCRFPESVRSGAHGTLLAGFDPLVSLVWADDHESYVTGWVTSFHEDHVGEELTFANVVTIRLGHVTDVSTGDSSRPTSGWGVGVPIGPWGGFRVDEARVSQGSDSGLPDVTRRGWTVWVDAVRIWRDLPGAGRSASARH